MILNRIAKVYPTEQSCIDYLESIIWNGEPVCPYCKSKAQTRVKNESRYHCNGCNTKYSITVNTPFHKSKVDLRKWFIAIFLIDNISSRGLAEEIKTTKDTAYLMIQKLKSAKRSHPNLMQKIVIKVQEINN